jgi:Zn-dependent protease
VAGVDLRIHATFLLLVAIVAVGSSAPGGPGAVAGLLWLVALFACVVLHELAHSLVSIHHGIPIREIELLPIGGVSKMERSPEDPGVELRIAAAGPAASVALSALFAGTALLARVPMWPPTLYEGVFLARLAWVNLLLAAFNLIPALPLDGGRVLRAFLEERSDRLHATQVAARAGRMFASAMIGLGLFFNIWLLLIGVFVYFGSWAEEMAAVTHERIKDLRVRDVMIHEPIVLRDAMPTDRASETLWRDAQRELPVVDGSGRYVGLVTASDLLGAAPGTTVNEVADATAPVLGPDDALETSGLLGGEVVAAAVVSSGRVVGLARAVDAGLVAQRTVGRGAPAGSGAPAP